MTKYTAEEIKNLTTIDRWKLRDCSICNSPLFYWIHPERERVAFDSSCDCNRLDGWEECGWQGIADHLNIQTNEEYRDRCIRELKGS